jgi:hypothetical protein
VLLVRLLGLAHVQHRLRKENRCLCYDNYFWAILAFCDFSRGGGAIFVMFCLSFYINLHCFLANNEFFKK